MHAAPSLQAALSQKFRADQVRVGATAGKLISAAYTQGFQIRSARDSWARIRPRVLGILSVYYAADVATGQRYYNASRISYGLKPFAGDVGTLRLRGDHAGQVIDSTGLGMFLHYVKGGALMMDAFTQARYILASASGDLVMSGARDYITAASSADPSSDGWKRITHGTCDWCEERAAAGPTTDDGEWHNYCMCTAEPSFTGESSGARIDLSSLLGSSGSAGATDAAEGALDDAVTSPSTDVTRMSHAAAMKILGKWVAAGSISTVNRGNNGS